MEEEEEEATEEEAEPAPAATYQQTMLHIFDLETVTVAGRMVPCLAVLKLEGEARVLKFHRNREDIDDDATVKMLKFIMEKFGNSSGKKRRRRRILRTETHHMFLSHNGSRLVSVRLSLSLSHVLVSDLTQSPW